MTDPFMESTWSPSAYAIRDLLEAGAQFMGEFYDQEAAVQHFLRLHPGASEAEVRGELEAKTA